MEFQRFLFKAAPVVALGASLSGLANAQDGRFETLQHRLAQCDALAANTMENGHKGAAKREKSQMANETKKVIIGGGTAAAAQVLQRNGGYGSWSSPVGSAIGAIAQGRRDSTPLPGDSELNRIATDTAAACRDAAMSDFQHGSAAAAAPAASTNKGATIVDGPNGTKFLIVNGTAMPIGGESKASAGNDLPANVRQQSEQAVAGWRPAGDNDVNRTPPRPQNNGRTR